MSENNSISNRKLLQKQLKQASGKQTASAVATDIDAIALDETQKCIVNRYGANRQANMKPEEAINGAVAGCVSPDVSANTQAMWKNVTSSALAATGGQRKGLSKAIKTQLQNQGVLRKGKSTPKNLTDAQKLDLRKKLAAGQIIKGTEYGKRLVSEAPGQAKLALQFYADNTSDAAKKAAAKAKNQTIEGQAATEWAPPTSPERVKVVTAANVSDLSAQTLERAFKYAKMKPADVDLLLSRVKGKNAEAMQEAVGLVNAYKARPKKASSAA